MTLILQILIALALAVDAHAQWSMNVPKDAQRIVGSIQGIVHTNEGEKSINLGSGFTFDSGKWIYLATAKHVIANAVNNGVQLKYTVHAVGAEENIPSIYTINTSSVFVGHGIFFSPNKDVAIVRLGRFSGRGIFESPLNITQSSPGLPKTFDPKKVDRKIATASPGFSAKYSEVEVAEDIFIFGYPSSLNNYPDIVPLQYNSEWPLFRKGIVAGKNDDTQQIIIDGLVHPGNSGGPVIRNKPLSVTQKQISLIGILTNYVPFVSKARNEHGLITNVNVQNAGYSLAEPIDALLDLIESAER